LHQFCLTNISLRVKSNKTDAKLLTILQIDRPLFSLRSDFLLHVIKMLHRVLLCAVDKRSDCGAGAYLIEGRYDLYLLDIKVWTQTFLITINFQIKLIPITL
jgi:hypothetical protein